MSTLKSFKVIQTPDRVELDADQIKTIIREKVEAATGRRVVKYESWANKHNGTPYVKIDLSPAPTLMPINPRASDPFNAPGYCGNKPDLPPPPPAPSVRDFPP